jgi:hypothetical protein
MIFDVIAGRKSVRTYDGTGITEEDRQKLLKYIDGISNPFGIPVQFVLLDAEEYGLSSPVLVGEKLYVAGKVPKGPCADVAFGYSFEKLVLYAWSLGIGTVWIGGTMNREDFEKAAGLQDGEMMPCMSPLGYPAKKRSFRETMMRKGVGADLRLSTDKLFFDRAWGVPLHAEGSDELRDLMEMVRWAPSAVNKQPWRIIAADGCFHFYEKQDKGYVGEKTGDLQKVDVGIALCHFVMGMEANGEQPQVTMQDPGLPLPEGVHYIAAVKPGAPAQA